MTNLIVFNASPLVMCFIIAIGVLLFVAGVMYGWTARNNYVHAAAAIAEPIYFTPETGFSASEPKAHDDWTKIEARALAAGGTVGGTATGRVSASERQVSASPSFGRPYDSEAAAAFVAQPAMKEPPPGFVTGEHCLIASLGGETLDKTLKAVKDVL